MHRDSVFARDEYRCVYCGEVFEGDMLTLDHVQPRARGGDQSGGNLVTACGPCNVAKGHARLADFLVATPVARANFLRYARHVWPRHLRALDEEMAARERRSVGRPRE